MERDYKSLSPNSEVIKPMFVLKMTGPEDDIALKPSTSSCPILPGGARLIVFMFS
jgi:hypothetical protein